MKRLVLVTIVVLTATIVINSCNTGSTCENINKRSTTLLIDISDANLLTDIEGDIKTNFANFWERTQIGSIGPCQSFKLSLVELSSSEDLKIVSKSITIEHKNQSRNKNREDASPLPLFKMLRDQLDDYKQYTEDPQTTSGSSISNVLLKAINQSDPDDENFFFVFSDMVENNSQINFYKGIPDKKDVKKFVVKLIEPSVLEEYFNKRKSGLQVKVIVVLKEEPSRKTDRRLVKSFWIEVFNVLKLDVQFVDNLSNTINL